MVEWKPELKRYPHFDRHLSEDKILSIVTNPAHVARNAFFPFMLYNKKVGRFDRKEKVRPIRYAARRDAYIYAYYRHLLSDLYEAKLKELGIADCPIAYRKIPVSAENLKGKCNIHFAKEAFQQITSMGSCYALAMDISSYFESLDHNKLYQTWCDLLGVESLPPDHEAVYKAITRYTVVDLDECYKRLGYKGTIEINGVKKWGFTCDPRKIRMQLCPMRDFRQKICGQGGMHSQLTVQNKEVYGIPQGSPISDLLANIYLLDFDKKMADYATANGAYYRRYSDDILFICPANADLLAEAMQMIRDDITNAGPQLLIKDEKTNLTQFTKAGDEVIATPLLPAGKHKPFEYLGFAFDGKTVQLRDSTLSKYYRKMTFGIRKEAANLVARYPGKTAKEILELANISAIYQKYGKIEEFEDNSDYTEWNFWTYTRRAVDVMGTLDNIILHQLRNHKKKLVSLLHEEVPRQFVKAQQKKKQLRLVDAVAV